MILTLKGNVPSLKNDKKIIYLYRNGRKTPSIASSDRAVEWANWAVPKLRTAFMGYKIKDYPITLEFTFWFDNDRRHDLDNAVSGVLDAMSKAEVIGDDNVKHINRLIVNYGGIDKKNPRVEILIED